MIGENEGLKKQEESKEYFRRMFESIEIAKGEEEKYINLLNKFGEFNNGQRVRGKRRELLLFEDAGLADNK